VARGLKGTELLFAESAGVSLGLIDLIDVKGLGEVVRYQVFEGGINRRTLNQVI
jgi:hypothetical protein